MGKTAKFIKLFFEVKMQSEQILNSQLHKTPIAIIGMASIFPKAKNLQEYWNNIIKKIDCITDVPISRWNIDDYYDPDQTAPDKTYCKRGGFIPNIDFNPMEFGLPPNILEVTDVSQLLSLVVTRDALIDAGYYKAAQEILNRTGVVLGVGGGQKLITPLTCRLQYPVWRKVLKSSGLSDNEIEPIVDKMKMAYIRWEENSFPGMLGNVIAGRVANAACASSLSAIRLAISELTEHRSDMMISGGVDTDNSIFMYLCFSKTPAFSKSDRVRTFDTNSDGMMIGEGLGMLILKRLEDAKRDNDRIYAIIKGIGASSDGKYKSIYAPRPQGQSLALQRAYADAGFEPNTIGLLEAHGTGTIAGDPSEIIALKSIFRNNSNEGQRIALGSVKSQIGHTKSAAGAAGMIKAALALHHKILPATINVSTPNPKYEIENSSFYINSETRPWLRADSAHPRRAGISAFGFGGTNFHIVLEEYNGEHAQPYRIHQVPQSIMLAAKTMPRLLAHITDLLASLDSETAEDNFAHIVAESKKINIEFDMPRLGFVAETPEEAKSLLEIARQKLQKNPGSEAWNHPKGIFYRQSHLNPNGKIVALFSGQGSQYVDMGRELFLNFPPMRQTLGKLDEHFLDDGLKPVSKVIFPPPAFDEHTHSNQTAALQNTEYAQPAIGVVSAALYKILHGAGFQPDFVAGHSFGELTALWAGNTLNDHDFFQLIKARGQAMAAPNRTNFDSGKMLAIKGDVNRLENDLRQFPDIIMANFNSPSQVVLAGSTFAIAEIEKTLKDKGYHVVSLPVSAAFHTPLVKHAQKPFAQAINKATFSSPKIAVYSNSTGGRYSNSPVTIKQTLADHILKPVLFKKQIENIYQAGGYFFVEFGPRSILTNLVKEILKDKPHIALSLNASRRKNSDLQLRTAVVQLRVMGFPLKDIDPYGYVLARLEKPKRKTLNIHLSGQNYVSEKTQAAFEDVIKHDVTSSHNMSNNNQSVINNPTDHHPPSSQEIIHKPTPKPSENHKINVTIHSPSLVDPHPSSSTTRKEERLEVGGERLQIKRVKPEMKPTIPKTDKISVRQPKPKPVPPDVISSHAPPTMLKSDYQELVSDLEGRLQKIQSHQTETLQVHEQYLTNQVEYSKTFFQLMREQQQMLARVTDKGTLSPEVVSSLERSMLTFHEHQTDTLRVHEAYLNNQIEYTKQFFDLTQHESDVGIDVSDKPIARSPHSYIQKPAQAKPTIYVKPIISSEVVPLSPQPKPVATVPMPSNDAIAQTLLDVVSEKTGYPNDMLTMDMDVEVDLGVDSIKRVEILGELQSHYPELPQVSMDDLGSLRTLAQIVDYVHGLGVRSSEFGDERSDVKVQSWELGVGSPEFEGNGRELSFSGDQVFEIDYDEKLESESQELGVGGWEFEVGSSKSEIKPSVDFGQIQDGLLQVVSEKTGYPIDMLDVDMDMEADLGIDSIKRVEIFGAMQDMFPELPAIDLDKLTDLRTLQQVIENVGGQDSSVKASFDPPGFNASDGGSVKARGLTLQMEGLSKQALTLKDLMIRCKIAC
ncbi:MAG: hypothetical protein B6242_05230 [Anaerolineaceae bacterium 4572_78]|nr:MAG: hypothetical protein B6242_05230 [Anaerolineaceae bacterium 4572_78]